jgi:hypothetical protein
VPRLVESYRPQPDGVMMVGAVVKGVVTDRAVIQGVETKGAP